MNPQPWTGVTKPPMGAEHEPKVKRAKTVKEQADAEEAEYLEYLHNLRASIWPDWGRP